MSLLSREGLKRVGKPCIATGYVGMESLGSVEKWGSQMEAWLMREGPIWTYNISGSCTLQYREELWLIQGQGYLYKVLRGLVFSFVKSLFFMSREPRKCTCIYVNNYHCSLVPINVHIFTLHFRAFWYDITHDTVFFEIFFNIFHSAEWPTATARSRVTCEFPVRALFLHATVHWTQMSPLRCLLATRMAGQITSSPSSRLSLIVWVLMKQSPDSIASMILDRIYSFEKLCKTGFVQSICTRVRWYFISWWMGFWGARTVVERVVVWEEMPM